MEGIYRGERRKPDPAGVRETEFNGGMLVAAFPPVRRLLAYE